MTCSRSQIKVNLIDPDFSRLIKVVNPIELPILWIHKNEHKITRPAAGGPAALFSMRWQFSFIDERNIWLFNHMRFALFGYLLLAQFHRMLVRKACQIEAVSHDFDDCLAIHVNEIGSIGVPVATGQKRTLSLEDDG